MASKDASLLIRKPKNQKAKRALERRAPKLVENVKKSLVLKGTKTSEVVTLALKDLHIMKKPDSVLFQRNNNIHPFESAESLQFLCRSSDCSLFAFGNHSKKRPHNLVLGRMFDFQVLDMFELGVEPSTFRPMQKFQGSEGVIQYGSKPAFLFLGDDFENKEEYQVLKNLFLDYFRGVILPQINLEGLSRLIVVAAAGGKIYFRQFCMVLKKTGSKIPNVSLDEVGPHIDFIYRRRFSASAELQKQALRKPRSALTPKKVKNEEEGFFHEKLGRLRMDKQDFDKMALAHMKGLKKRKGPSKDAEEEGEGDAGEGAEESGEEAEQPGRDSGEDVEEEEVEVPQPKKSKKSRK
eukprot:TRINITY_DN7807_c0_g1_i3.p1 TRINITY_DN7807_c0_g1~~TRINITY_DN7807_c0_g1_i3.p1  ORF type:complete len:351 (-),score=80.01 TRINITY_DN7807_c0_g1_i3:8-1060(-)